MQQYPGYCQDALLTPIDALSCPDYSTKSTSTGSTLYEFRRSNKRQPAKTGRWTHWLYRWAIDRLTSLPYSRWLSRIVDRLLIAIENGGGSNV